MLCIEESLDASSIIMSSVLHELEDITTGEYFNRASTPSNLLISNIWVIPNPMICTTVFEWPFLNTSVICEQPKSLSSLSDKQLSTISPSSLSLILRHHDRSKCSNFLESLASDKAVLVLTLEQLFSESSSKHAPEASKNAAIPSSLKLLRQNMSFRIDRQPFARNCSPTSVNSFNFEIFNESKLAHASPINFRD
uniref:Uncharacterized protein n=1 Tax=Spongospora subterranea TaxID=70186 RepID=A0A0H5QIW5_9EUKA|eukprot:CRZ01938.1 hypothetical protein [Spongospora subterranea]